MGCRDNAAAGSRWKALVRGPAPSPGDLENAGDERGQRRTRLRSFVFRYPVWQANVDRGSEHLTAEQDPALLDDFRRASPYFRLLARDPQRQSGSPGGT